MRLLITAPDKATRDAALVAVKLQQFPAASPAAWPSAWSMTLADDGVSATLDTDSAIVPAGLPAGASALPIAPSSVALWQAKAALHQVGLLDQASAATAAMNSPVLNAFWANASTLERASPTLASLATALNLSSAQVDALFIAAAQIAL